jgi:hypothetical protein
VTAAEALDSYLKSDRDLDEFIFNHFYDVWKQIWPGMNRKARIALLLSKESEEQIVAKIKQDRPGAKL